MQEVWKFYKEIKHSNKYFKKGDILTVSDWGRVKCNREFYKCRIGTDGYYRLCGKPLHRIIAEKFISGWNEKFEVDHKDCNKLNNMVTNLLVCLDHKQNMANPLTRQHCKEAQNNPIAIQHQREISHKKPVLQYTKDGKFVAEYASIMEAERTTKINQGNIVNCCKNKKRYKSAGGYIWKYKNI